MCWKLVTQKIKVIKKKQSRYLDSLPTDTINNNRHMLNTHYENINVIWPNYQRNQGQTNFSVSVAKLWNSYSALLDTHKADLLP